MILAQLVRAALVLVVVSTAATLIALSAATAYSGTIDRWREVTLPGVLAVTGVLLLAGGIGLWVGRRWAAILVAGVAATHASWLVIAMSGIILRALRMGIGTSLYPLLAAAALVALGAWWLSRRMREADLGPMTTRISMLVWTITFVGVGGTLWRVLIDSGPDGIPAGYAGLIATVAALPVAVIAAGASRLWSVAGYRPWSAALGGLAVLFAGGLFVAAAPFFGVLFENIAADCPVGMSTCI